ncbi:AAA family ATPase [Pyrococcus abyssi]|uniref:ATPase n=1 Tax=Pyrococcus abyssi (strain GE5 / Orsay) TaxID=272844 RepID=Q9UZ50_PYRAB|nr:ATP-binding protein [Pyrococcus abyssi]CAB50209.1 Hypothetical protein, containing DUF238 domain [Pyrococcus abyssi GE5]CCE70745.1 TPA: ATPase [Pyrococcus abyssi GE5]
MLFDPRPKTEKKDLYDRERELKEFQEALKLGENIILLLGIRRLGKSSLLNVGLKESNFPYSKVDVRSLYFAYGTIPQDVLARKIIESLLASEKSLYLTLRKILESIKGIKISGIHVEFERRQDLPSIFERIDLWAEREGKKVVIAFDEAQYLRLSGVRYDGLIAYAIDNLPNIIFILTGSEVGMLHDFLGLDNPKKPLFGRQYEEIVLDRFTRDESFDFLRRGFEELNANIPDEEIEEVVNRIDGIVGWLTLYGYLRGVKKLGKEESLISLYSKAKALIEEELSHILAYSKRYKFILKAVALGNTRWKNIKEYVEFRTGRINDAKFSNLLKNLVKYGYLEKRDGEYIIPDPLVKEIVANLK